MSVLTSVPFEVTSHFNNIPFVRHLRDSQLDFAHISFPCMEISLHVQCACRDCVGVKC